MEVGEDGALTFAAADGFRLARLTGYVSEDSPTPKPGKYIIPARSIMELDVLDSEHVSVYQPVGRNYIAFVGHDVEVHTRLVDGNYVDIQRVIPVDFCIGFTAQSDDLVSMCKALKPFARCGANIMRLTYSYGKLTGSASA
jgi:DNA polymerase III sliding clamp (beta) subunit (PCNA family)